MCCKWNIAIIVATSLAMLMASCSRPSSHQAQGYIEGRYTYMATSVSGALTTLSVVRGTRVKVGDQLVVLQPRPESDLYDAAVENLKDSMAARNAVAANLQYAKRTYERYKVLVPRNAIQQSALDNAQSIYEATTAQLAQANAHITSVAAVMAQTKWSTEQKILYAPADAIVFDVYYRLGEYTIANQPILSLLAPSDIKVIFYVEEKILGQLKLGDTVTVQCDGCRQSYPAKISFISPSAEYTPPVIYSNETNAKLIYRIEAAFQPSIAYNLHPGQPVAVTVGSS